MKVLQIIPYFGKLPNLLPFFLKGVRTNQQIDWIFFIDDDWQLDTPPNLKIVKITFPEFKKLIYKKLGDDIVLDFPHKICDYRPAFGVIFEEWLTGYDFWGHCDFDVIYGNLEKFLTSEMFTNFDKIFLAGHFSLYRNTSEINNLFRRELNGVQVYKDIFNSTTACAFDEAHCRGGGIVQLLKVYNYRVFEEDYCINFNYEKTGFYTTLYNSRNQKFSIDPNYRQIISWNDGKLLKHKLVGNEIICTEHMYIHFHKRNMDIKVSSDSTSFLIIPNKIIALEPILAKTIVKYTQKSFIDYQFYSTKFKNLKIKMRNYFLRHKK